MRMFRTKLFLARFMSKLNRSNPARKAGTLSLNVIDSLDQYKKHQQASSYEYMYRSRVEKQLEGSQNGFDTPGYCYVCSRNVNFYTSFSYAFTDAEGNQKPNWREHLRCPSCGLNNRIRAAIQIFEQTCKPRHDDTIYLTEQITPLFKWFARNYQNVVGSEYLGNKVSFGQVDKSGLRNETLTDLTFSDNKFNYILSFDVFEHIPDYLSAFRECLRCLKPEGVLIFSVPFQRNSAEHIVRARVLSNGEVEHILPPEYHGDPLNSSGTLCFYHFGWELLEQLRRLGFGSAKSYLYWSREFGYLGQEQMMFIARKDIPKI